MGKGVWEWELMGGEGMCYIYFPYFNGKEIGRGGILKPIEMPLKF